jgi:hypothetical protein
MVPDIRPRRHPGTAPGRVVRPQKNASPRACGRIRAAPNLAPMMASARILAASTRPTFRTSSSASTDPRPPVL